MVSDEIHATLGGHVLCSNGMAIREAESEYRTAHTVHAL